MKQTIFILFVLLVGFSPTNSFAEKTKQNKIEIGWIGPLTGGAALLGVDALEAVRMALEEIHADELYTGPKIELVVEDDQYSTAKTVTAYNNLVHNRGIKILFIYTYSGLFALAPKAEREGVLLLDPLDCDEDVAALPSNVICIAKLTEDMGFIAGEHAAKNSKTPAGILFVENDAFPIKMASSTKEKLESLGHKVNFYQGYQATTNDFRSILLKIKALSIKSLFIYGYTEIGIALKQLKELGLDLQVYSLSNVTSPDIRSVAGDATEDVVFPNWKATRNRKFKTFMKKFMARKGAPPVLEVSTVPSYDTTYLISEALNNYKADSNTPAWKTVKDYFYKLEDYPGASGEITIGPDGATRSFRVVIQQLKKGEVRNIKMTS